MAPATSSIVRLSPGALQVTQRGVTHEDHLTAPSPITTIGATSGNVRFTAEAGRAIPAGTGLHFDPGTVVEHSSIVTAARDRRTPTVSSRSISGVSELVGEVEPCRGRDTRDCDRPEGAARGQLPPRDDRGQHVDTIDKRAQRLHTRADDRVVERLKGCHSQREVACAKRSRKVKNHRLAGVLASKPASYHLLGGGQHRHTP